MDSHVKLSFDSTHLDEQIQHQQCQINSIRRTGRREEEALRRSQLLGDRQGMKKEEKEEKEEKESAGIAGRISFPLKSVPYAMSLKRDKIAIVDYAIEQIMSKWTGESGPARVPYVDDRLIHRLKVDTIDYSQVILKPERVSIREKYSLTSNASARLKQLMESSRPTVQAINAQVESIVQTQRANRRQFEDEMQTKAFVRSQRNWMEQSQNINGEAAAVAPTTKRKAGSKSKTGRQLALVDISNRVRTSKVTHIDSKYRNEKHEQDHLRNKYALEQQTRQGVIDRMVRDEGLNT